MKDFIDNSGYKYGEGITHRCILQELSLAKMI